MEFVLFTVFQFKDKVLSLVDKQVIRKKKFRFEKNVSDPAGMIFNCRVNKEDSKTIKTEIIRSIKSSSLFEIIPVFVEATTIHLHLHQ
jgi:hypothetical protein